jgi:transcriptional regulator with XRE-family HTH domain
MAKPNWIAKMVHQRGWTIRRFGREIGVSATHAGRLVNGIKAPSPELARVIARVFGVPELEVFERVGLIKSSAPISNDEHRDLIALISALPPSGRKAVEKFALSIQGLFPDE